MSIAHADAAFARPQAPALAGRWEMAAAALCLAQFSEPLFAAIAQSQGLTEPPGYARIFFLPVYAFLAWVIWREPRAALRAVTATPLLTGLLALAFMSTLWSIDSGATLRRSVWLALTMAFGFYLAWRYSWRELIEVVAGAFAVLIAGSFATAIVAPAVGIMTQEHVGAWSGLWTHKNTLGGIMALGVAVGAGAAIMAPERRKLWIGVALGALLLVLLSTSKTALIASLLGLGAIAAGALIRRGPLQTILVVTSIAAAIVVIASVTLLAPDLLVAALGRDLTLTGRTDIWAAAAPAVAAQPWLGYGYYAFWLPDNGPAYWVREQVQWQVASAHSGWLELALGLGRAGVVLFALQLFATLRRGTGAVMRSDAGLWAPAFLAAFALYTLSESHVLQANNLFWTIYVAVAARLALDSKHT
ncbi:O-antigen ligase family protein [Terricaulis sp.]|uniref:O-antigen ligase family protein n=1 Tax=Terricaulis sp. TaxID=2768686 RepID=UPI003783D182